MANAIKSKNPDYKPAQVQKIVESKIGRLFWSSKKDDFGAVVSEEKGEPFYLKSTGRGGFTARPRSEKTNRRARNSAERRRNLQISNVGRSKAEIKAANQKAAEIKATGKQVDHNGEAARTGRALRAMNARLRRQQYRDRVQPGDRVANIQGLEGAPNRRKNRELNKLDKYLGQKEAVSPSPSLQPDKMPKLVRTNGAVKFTVPLPKPTTKPSPTPTPKPTRTFSPAGNRGVIQSSVGIVKFALQPSTRSVNTGLGGPHIFIP